jgi:hypothetical protein
VGDGDVCDDGNLFTRGQRKKKNSSNDITIDDVSDRCSAAVAQIDFATRDRRKVFSEIGLMIERKCQR